MALAGLQHVLVKAAHSARTVTASISRLSLDTGLARDPATGAGRAEAVEQCQCPPGYRGLSCEECAPGHTRAGRGLYLGHCEPCQCGGKSASCDPDTGTCLVMWSLAASTSTIVYCSSRTAETSQLVTTARTAALATCGTAAAAASPPPTLRAAPAPATRAAASPPARPAPRLAASASAARGRRVAAVTAAARAPSAWRAAARRATARA